MRSLATLVFLVAACSPAHGVEISNFRSGLACAGSAADNGGRGWICHVTEDILVTDYGRCRYAKETLPCTWVGFEFDYRDAQPGAALDCVEESDRPTAIGNPDREIARNRRSHHFTIPLEAGSGHFYNPQYFEYSPQPAGETLLVTKVSCSIDGKPAFAYTYRLHQPERSASREADR
jgi:hypothetical protein